MCASEPQMGGIKRGKYSGKKIRAARLTIERSGIILKVLQLINEALIIFVLSPDPLRVRCRR